jgi:hypothetical protein
MDSKKINVGVKHEGRSLLGFELKITPKADIYMFVFERGHRRMHISYHADGRIHYKADRPNHDAVFIESDFRAGIMEPIKRQEVRPTDVVNRQRMGVTGWGVEDIKRAELNEFTPGPEDVLIDQPEALSIGFCVNVVGPQAPKRAISGDGVILERRVIKGAVTVEIEVFDWLVDSRSALDRPVDLQS